MNVDNGNTGDHSISYKALTCGGVSPLCALKRGRVRALVVGFLVPVVAAAQQIDPEVYQHVVDENIALRQEQARLTKEDNELRRKIAGLILDVQELERKRDQLTALVAQLRTPDETKNDLMRLQAEHIALAREIDRLRQALSVATATAATVVSSNAVPSVVAPEQGTSLFRKIEHENSELRQQLVSERESLKAAVRTNSLLVAHAGDMQAETVRLSDEVASLKKDLEQSRTKEATVWRAVERIARKSYQQQIEIEKLKEEIGKREIERGRSKAGAETRKAGGGASSNTNASVAGPIEGENPGDTAGLLRAAQKAIKSRELKDAERLYIEALKRTPKDALIHYNLGALYSDYLRNPDKAIYHYRRYLELNPRARDAAQVRSWLLELEIQSAE